MKIRAYHIIPLILIQFLSVLGQTSFEIPDTNFRNKLISDYPQVMSGLLLDSAAAADFSDQLKLDSAGITNAEGIQYFQSITFLSMKWNKLVSIPQITQLPQLERLYLSNNQLTSLPRLDTLTKVIDLHVHENQLTEIPPLNKLIKLNNFYCHTNKLNSLPDFSNNSPMISLVVGNNPLTVQPDFSALINLWELHVNQCNLTDTINGLSKMKNLGVLFAWGNKLRDLSALNNNTKLQVFQVFHNELTSLPNLLNKSFLYYVSFSNNYLTFEDIIPLRNHSNFNSFGYNPQKEIALPNYNQRELDSFTMHFGIDSTISNNQYIWLKDGTPIDTTSSPSKVFTNVSTSQKGTYSLQITNPVLPDLTLYTSPSTLFIKACMEITSITPEQTFINCEKGFTISFSELTTLGGVAPFKYQLYHNGALVSENNSNALFEEIESGKYQFIISDSRGSCKVSSPITVSANSDCDLIFTPNGDGVMDSFFVEESGLIKIYDSSRKLVSEFYGPASWDGTSSDGSLVQPGLYAIVINNQKVIRITLLR